MSAGSVSVENLVVRYGAAPAVAGLSLAIAAGEHVTLLGPSGCGKTTTLRAIAGLERPSSGRIVVDGTVLCDPGARIDLPPERRCLSMVFQSYAIWPHMSVFENVAFPLSVRGVNKAEARRRVETALALVDLAGFADRPATRLSGGQQQRVAVARAIVHEDALVLFDEPLSNLDAQLRAQMRTELAELRARLRLTALYVTHDQEEAFALSDRIIVMRDGSIEQEGAPAEIYRTPRSRFVARFLGVANILPVEIAAATGDGAVMATLPDGTVLRARDPWGQGERGKASVAFRANRVQLGAPAAGRGAHGTVVRSLFLGDTVQSRVTSGPIEVLSETHQSQGFADGTAVGWSVDPADCLVLRE